MALTEFTGGNEFLGTTTSGMPNLGISPSDVLDQDWSDQVKYLNPNAIPFTRILDEIGKVATTEMKFNWFTGHFPRKRDQVNLAAGYAAGVVSIVVDNGDAWEAGCIGLCERTGSPIYVTAVNTNTLTVSATAQALVDGDWLRILPVGRMDGATLGNIKMDTFGTEYNYCQEVRTAFGEPLNYHNSRKRAGIGLDETRARKLMEHEIEKDEILIFAPTRYAETTTHTIYTTDANSRHYSMGILPALSTHICDFGGQMITETDMLDAMERAFDTGSERKVCLAGAKFRKVLDQFASKHYQMPNTNETWGLRVKRWMSSFGTLDIVNYKKFVGATYGSYALIIDPEDLKYRYLTDSDTRLMKDRAANDETAIKEELRSVMGLDWGQEANHAILKNFSG